MNLFVGNFQKWQQVKTTKHYMPRKNLTHTILVESTDRISNQLLQDIEILANLKTYISPD